MTKKRGVGEALASNPAMPIAAVLAGTAIGTALLSRSAHEGARELWQGIKAKAPQLPNFGGGGGSSPAQPVPLPPLAPASSSPLPTIVNITNPAPIVQTAPRITPAPFPAPTAPSSSSSPSWWDRLTSFPSTLRDQGVQFFPGTRVPVPTAPRVAVETGYGLGRALQQGLVGLTVSSSDAFWGGVGTISGFAQSAGGASAANRARVAENIEILQRGARNTILSRDIDIERGSILDNIRSTYLRNPPSPRASPIPTRRGTTSTSTRTSGNSGGSGGSFGGANSYAGGSLGSRRPIGTFVPIRRR